MIFTFAEILVVASVLSFAYVISALFVGWSELGIRKLLGDGTVTQVQLREVIFGVYINLIDLIILLASNILFHWFIATGSTLPIIPAYVQGTHRRLRLFLICATAPLMRIFLALAALLASCFLLGPQALDLRSLLFLESKITFGQFLSLFSGLSSLTIIAGMVLGAIIALNMILALIGFIMNMLRYAVNESTNPTVHEYAELIVFLGTLIALALCIQLQLTHYLLFFLRFTTAYILSALGAFA